MHISQQDAQAWLEKSKLTLSSLESGLEGQIATQVLGRIAQAYDTSAWVDSSTTPPMVRSIIAMYYAAWLYSKTYSEDETGSNWYADQLRTMADALVLGIIDGTTDIGVVPDTTLAGTGPAYYPSDLSSAQTTTADDPSLGPAAFTMGKVF
jgi:hypothetical protein